MPNIPETTPRREEWGWTSYRRTGWVRDDGVREYRAHLRTAGSVHHWTRVTITFWARRPIVSLRQLVASRRSVDEIQAFDDQTIS